MMYYKIDHKLLHVLELSKLKTYWRIKLQNKLSLRKLVTLYLKWIFQLNKLQAMI